MKVRILKIVALSGGVIAISGCATTAQPTRLAYYKVPCSTPGAVVAEPISLDGPVARPGGTPATATPPAAEVAKTCVVAVADARSANRFGYPGFYGRPYYGSIGIGFGFGGHGGNGGHRGGGHVGHSSGHGRRH